jgi:hypothetical protein
LRMIILTINFYINMKKNLKNRFFYGYVLLLIDWLWFKFYAILLSFVSTSNYNHCKLYKFLMVLDEVLNNNEITWNLNHHKSISRKIYP